MSSTRPSSCRKTASSVTASKPKAGKTTSGRVSKPAPTTRITRSAAVKAPPKEPEGATEQDMSRDFVEIGLTAQYLLKTWESGLGRPKHEGKTRGYKHLRLSRRAGSEWALFDPLNKACFALGDLPAAMAPYQRYEPGNRRVLEFRTPYKLESFLGSETRFPMLARPSVRMRCTPAALRDCSIEYTMSGPRLRPGKP